MYGGWTGSGFYHEIEAENDDDCIRLAFSYMDTVGFHDRRAEYSHDCDLYQIMEGDISDISRKIVWDYFNGKLR